MLRLIAFLIAIALLAAGLAWLADRPGELVMEWQGYHVETSVFRAIVLLVALVALALTCWSILRNAWYSPAAVGTVLTKRRQKLGLDALSSGMIALGAGDKAAAMRSAIQARKSLPNEPLTPPPARPRRRN
ncbi:MAG: heme biosynthesis HemY N-terminal domain-containing protein [Hyphomicrobium sp.]